MTPTTIIGLITLAIVVISAYMQIPPESIETIEARKKYGGIE